MMVYTASLDYCATGEGCTPLAQVDTADNEDHLRAAAAQVFGDYFASGLEIAPHRGGLADADFQTDSVIDIPAGLSARSDEEVT